MNGAEGTYKTTVRLKKTTGKSLRISAYELECSLGEIIDVLVEKFLEEYKEERYEMQPTVPEDLLPIGERSGD